MELGKKKFILIKSFKFLLESLSLLFYSIFLIIPLVILRIKGYKLARIKSDRIGHLICETFCIKNDLELENYKIIFLIKMNQIANIAYIEMFKSKYDNYFIELPNFIFRSIRLPNCFFVDVDIYTTKTKAPKKSVSIFARQKEFFKIKNLPTQSIDLYKKFLVHNSIQKSDNIVILHFRSHHSSFSDETQHYLRNSDAESYSLMVNYLCKNGFHVVRVGDKGINVGVKDKKYIDYANSKFKSQFLDLALVAHCNFFIGGSTGAVFIPAIFNKPILGVNMSMPFNYSPTGRSNEMGAPKLIIDAKSQKLISITDSFSKKFYQIRISEDLISLGYTLKDNSPEDLEMLVKEFLNFIKNSKKSKKHKIVQNYVKSIPKAIDSDFETESHFSVSFFHKYYSTDIKGKVI